MRSLCSPVRLAVWIALALLGFFFILTIPAYLLAGDLVFAPSLNGKPIGRDRVASLAWTVGAAAWLFHSRRRQPNCAGSARPSSPSGRCSSSASSIARCCSRVP